MELFTEDELDQVITGYETSKNAALRRRDERLREFHAHGWRPVDLQRVTGYSRETIRQALHPEARQSANTSRRKDIFVEVKPAVGSATNVAGRPGGYSARKPYVVPECLDDLRGPTEGTVNLAEHLDWSGKASYDLDKPARLASMYRAVLNEANSPDDLHSWIDRRLLVQLWPSLWLPAALRRLWESRFPELAALSTKAISANAISAKAV